MALRPTHRSPFLGRLRERQARRDHEASIVAYAEAVRGAFREACTGLNICHYVQVAAGVTVRTPASARSASAHPPR